MGAHSFKAGGGVILREFGVIQSQTPLGTFTFNRNLTRSTAGYLGGDGWRRCSSGIPRTSPATTRRTGRSSTRTSPVSIVQDDWRHHDWLTLNMGLRYDVFTPFNDEEQSPLELGSV